jgi:hypothetical protein
MCQIGEIEIRGRFHQPVNKPLLHAPIPKAQKDQQSIHQCLFALFGSSHAKAAHKTLMKLRSGVNFINVLRAAFTLVDPESIKKIENLTVFFTLLESAHITKRT